MIVFASSPDWAEPVAERIGYLTEVLRAYDGDLMLNRPLEPE
jgi:hypothetical protein